MDLLLLAPPYPTPLNLNISIQYEKKIKKNIVLLNYTPVLDDLSTI